MDIPLLEDHNKAVEKQIKDGRPDGTIKRAGVLCSICFDRDETEVELQVSDQPVRRSKGLLSMLQVFCPTCKKNQWMYL